MSYVRESRLSRRMEDWNHLGSGVFRVRGAPRAPGWARRWNSLLFRPVGLDRVEPMHRRVAEYLGRKMADFRSARRSFVSSSPEDASLLRGRSAGTPSSAACLVSCAR